MPAKTPHHIIAIGASAGGVEEIHTFFEHTPLDGVAYVVIQHLFPDFKSRMVELLARHSKLLVLEAENGMEVKKNHVYLIPSSKFMIIRDGELYLSNKDHVKLPHLTINSFFQTLAKDCGAKAIGIIFSGMGSDGTEGIRAIKIAGGMVMARNPETSPFPSMPVSAITTGMVDFILEPEQMPQAIEDYVKYGGELLADNKDDDRNITEIIALIKDTLPLDFSDYKKTTILRRTKRRAASNNFNTLRGYIDYLKTAPKEAEALAKEFLISVTAFFRDKEAFDFIQKKVLPDIIKSLYPGQELKMWVAGCATGEEVYSIAILVAELLRYDLKDTVVKIFATDIDSVALTHAGRGIYSAEIVKNVGPDRLEQYFVREDNNYRIKSQIRKMVIFAQHDLVKNPPYCNMHFISCRNLLIYMTPVLQKKIFNMFLFGLKTNGYLFLGSSENPTPIIHNLEVINPKFKIYKALETKRESSFDSFSLPDVQEIKRIPYPLSREEDLNTTTTPALAEAIHRSLAKNLSYLAICIDENLHVVKYYGDTRFLLRKHFTTDLTELLPKTLNVALNTMRARSLKTNDLASVSGVRVNYEDLELIVTVAVSPIFLKSGRQKLYLVTIYEDKLAKSEQTQVNKLFDEKNYDNEYTLNLEEEVRDLKDRLNSAYEQLNSSNENMQSFNEELLSANEEMQSTNEEMQSVNEELHTINADYQLKNKELHEANDDLNNYFRSNINGQLFVDRNLRLMKFSPGTVRQINLLDTDIGRPISNITTNIKFDTIINDIKQVIQDGIVIHKEIETIDGKWYQVTTMPYVQQTDHKHNGAIITFNDITELKTTQQNLVYANKMLAMATASAEMGTWSINVQTREFTPSPRLKEIFGFYPDEEMTFEAAVSQIIEEHRPGVLSAIEATINQGEKYDIEYSLKRYRDGKIRWVRATGNLTVIEESQRSFTGLLHDITESKQDEIRKNDFIAMVSHELKTPLTSLYGYIHLLAAKVKKLEDTQIVSTLDKVHGQVRKMTSLIDGFLNVSEMEAGKIHLDKQAFEINALVKEIVEEAALTTTSHPVSLQLCSEVTIIADRVKIGQVVSNLLSNAIKYSPQGTSIDISCNMIAEYLQISVKDEGRGIKIEDQGKLFDRFYRVDNAEAQTISGFGIGLYLTAEIVKRHDGEIWVDSKINEGSTFHVKLPLPKDINS